MNKRYQRPALTEFVVNTEIHILANSLTNEYNIHVNKDDMEGGDGSDATKAYHDWEGIWD